LEASWAAASVGGKAPIDLGAAAFRSLADVRAAAAARGQAWWSVSPFGTAEAPPPRAWEAWEDPEPEVTVEPDEGRALASSAQPAAQHDRPAGTARRRLRGTRTARHRQVRGTGAAHRQRRRARVPRHRVRGEQARPARRPAVRADRPARPAVPVRRRGVADPA